MQKEVVSTDFHLDTKDQASYICIAFPFSLKIGQNYFFNTNSRNVMLHIKIQSYTCVICAEVILHKLVLGRKNIGI